MGNVLDAIVSLSKPRPLDGCVDKRKRSMHEGTMHDERLYINQCVARCVAPLICVWHALAA
jgi:hypothetical protein